MPIALCMPLAFLSFLPAVDAGGGASADEDVEILRAARLESSVHRRLQSQARTPQPVEILHADDLGRTPAWTLPDRLRYLAGIDVYQMRHGQFEVGLRGYNGTLNNRLLLMVDGRMQRIEELGVLPWTGSFFLSDIERVEVAKGPSSVTFGANAFGGAIDLRSRAVGEEHRLAVAGSAGYPGTGDVDATASGPLWGPTYFKVAAGLTELRDLPTVSSGTPHQASPRTRSSGDLDLRSDRSLLLAGMRLGGDLRLEASWLRTDHHPWEIVNGASTGSGLVYVVNQTAQARLTGSWIDVSVDRQWLDSEFHNQTPIYDPTSDFFYLQFGFRDVRDSARASVRIAGSRNSLMAGAEASRWRGRSNMWTRSGRFQEPGTWAEVETLNRAVFAEDQIQLGPQVLLTGGVRADDHSEVGVNTSPRAAINWVPDRDQFVLLSYSTGYRQPTAFELFQTDYFLQPNEGIRAERIHALELQWKRSGADGIDWSIGGFFNRANGLIWRLPLPAEQQQANFMDWLVNGRNDPTRGPGPVFQYDNLDNPVRVFGAEASVRLHVPGTGWSAWANGTWQRFRYEREIHFSSPGLTVPIPGGPTYYRYDVSLPRNVNEPPPWKANLGAEWWSRDGWFASAVGRAVAGRYVYDLGHSLYGSQQFVAAERLDAYACLDLAVGWRLAGSTERQLRLSCLDVFDSSHHEHYRATSDSLGPSKSNEQELASTIGRQVQVSLHWVF